MGVLRLGDGASRRVLLVARLGLVAVIVGLLAMHSLPLGAAGAQLVAARDAGPHAPHHRAHAHAHAPARPSASLHPVATRGCGADHAVECVPEPARRAGSSLDGEDAVVGDRAAVEIDRRGRTGFDVAQPHPAQPPPMTVLRR